jgi:hypothetical protein
MDQYAVTDLEIGRILIELKSKRFGIRDDRGAANGPEVVDAKLQPAVVKQIRNILIRKPAFTLNEAGIFPEILEFRRDCGVRSIAKNLR